MGLPNHVRTIYSSLTIKFKFLQVQHVGQVFANNQEDEKVLLEREK